MDWLYALTSIATVVVLALLLGWTEKNVRSSAAKAFIWIGSILLLLEVRFWDDHPLTFGLLALVALVDGLFGHISSSLIYWTIGIVLFWYAERRFRAIAAALLELAAEAESAKNKIENLKNSVRSKFDDIEGRLPPENEPSEKWWL
jgi:hypothetical protein